MCSSIRKERGVRNTAMAWSVAIGLLVAGPAIAARPAIGFVDVLRVQQEYGEARRIRSELEAESQKYDAELREGQARMAELEAKIASADAALQSTSDVAVRKRAEAEKEAQEAARLKLQADYTQRLRERRTRAESLQREINENLIERARAAVEKVARKHGLEAVLDARASLWGALDVTDEVLEVLNATPSSAPSPGPSPSSTAPAPATKAPRK